MIFLTHLYGLIAKVTGKAKQLGQVLLARSKPLSCYFYLYKKEPKGRKKKTLLRQGIPTVNQFKVR